MRLQDGEREDNLGCEKVTTLHGVTTTPRGSRVPALSVAYCYQGRLTCRHILLVARGAILLLQALFIYQYMNINTHADRLTEPSPTRMALLYDSRASSSQQGRSLKRTKFQAILFTTPREANICIQEHLNIRTARRGYAVCKHLYVAFAFSSLSHT